ncbi:MAG: PHP domain-containing protein, partial [Eubacterium sp.]|nr:PHP domain-containing protein [Eubacterium sp.]
YNVQHFFDYNVYGHIDYVFRYGPETVTSEVFENKYFPEICEIVEEILKNIIKNGKGIEINTGSLYRGMDFAHPHPLILKMYKELGGEILTIGSDAHDYEHIGFGFEPAKALAKAHDFKYFCTFKDMKPKFHPL